MTKLKFNDLKELNLDKEVLWLLQKNNLDVRSLCALSRKRLKEIGFSQKQINEIIIALQLNGLDLNKRYC